MERIYLNTFKDINNFKNINNLNIFNVGYGANRWGSGECGDYGHNDKHFARGKFNYNI